MDDTKIKLEWAKPHICTRAFIPFIDLLERRLPANVLKTWLLENDIPLKYLKSEKNWVSLEFQKHLIEFTRKYFDPNVLVLEAGRLAVRSDFLGTYLNVVLRHVFSLEEVYGRLPTYVPMFNSLLDIKIIDSKNGFSAIQCEPNLQDLSHEEIEIFRQMMPILMTSFRGYLEALPEAVGRSAAVVKMTEVGVIEGVPRYRLNVSYTIETLKFGRQILKALICGFVLAIGLFALGTSALAVLSSFICLSVVAYLYFSLRDAKFVLRQMAKTNEDAIEAIIDHYKKLNEARAKLKESEEQRLAGLKNEAVYKISRQVAHDIRSPITALSFISDRLNIEDVDIKRLLQSALQRVKEIANDLVRVSESDPWSNRKNVKQQVANLIDCLDNVVKEKLVMLQLGGQPSVDIVFEGKNKAVHVVAEEANLKRVLSNIFQNSIEAIAGNGTIVIRIKCEGASVTLEVQDNGRGIPEALMGDVMREGVSYGKAHSSESGTGLGLYYSKLMVDRWGGAIAIDSRVDAGTIVRISLKAISEPLV